MTDHMSAAVREALHEDQVISEFKEGDIKFNPTYKYDVGQHNFDSSRKQRIPSWTDRILYIDDGNRVKLVEYQSVPGVSMSDHKPVYAIFDVVTRKYVDQ